MPQISKYLFETDFADPENEHAKPKHQDDDGTEAPVFSEAELLSAREHGYEAGIAAGQAQAVAGIETQIGEVIETISGKLDAVHTEISGQKALAEQDVAILAGAIATKVTGTVSDQARLDLLECMITDCMTRLYQAPEVVAHVPADLEADLTTRLSNANLAVAVRVTPDPSLTGTDCRVAWDGGGAERVQARVWQEVEALLEHYVADGAPASPPEDAADSEDMVADADTDTAPAPEPEPSAEPPPDQATAPSEDADGVADASAADTPPLEQDGVQDERPAPGDQDG